MKPCRLALCNQQASLMGEAECYYHAKMAAGLLWPDDVTIRRQLGVRQTEPIVDLALRPSDVLTDPQLEFWALLRSAIA